MLTPDVLRQIRRLQLRAKRAVQTLLGGEYQSTFKGTGLSFEEVREYQPGDDVRTLDWNVTARMGSPFVKRYVEERELTILLAVDVSASQRFGSGVHLKRTVAAEIAALMAFAAISNNDRVGLLAFSDQIELFVPPNKGSRHVLRLLREVLYFEPKRTGTDLKLALEHLQHIQRRRAIVILLSDFLEFESAADAFRRTARKHDLIAVQTRDPLETAWPDVGLIPVEDAETGEQRLVDTADATVRTAFAKQAMAREQAFRKLARSAEVDVIDVTTDGNHFQAVMRFFQLRDRHTRSR